MCFLFTKLNTFAFRNISSNLTKTIKNGDNFPSLSSHFVGWFFKTPLRFSITEETINSGPLCSTLHYYQNYLVHYYWSLQKKGFKTTMCSNLTDTVNSILYVLIQNISMLYFYTPFLLIYFLVCVFSWP